MHFKYLFQIPNVYIGHKIQVLKHFHHKSQVKKGSSYLLTIYLSPNTMLRMLEEQTMKWLMKREQNVDVTLHLWSLAHSSRRIHAENSPSALALSFFSLLCVLQLPLHLLISFFSTHPTFIISCCPLLLLSAPSSPSSISPVSLRSGWRVNYLGAPQSLFLKEYLCIWALSYLCVLYHLTALSYRSLPHWPAPCILVCVFTHLCVCTSVFLSASSFPLCSSPVPTSLTHHCLFAPLSCHLFSCLPGFFFSLSLHSLIHR